MALAAADPDLKRLTPVADDQQIPVGDFPPAPASDFALINRAGTGISAIVTAGEDRHLLLVYDVKTRKFGTIGGTGDYDITGCEWLGNTRVLYSVSGQKLVGIGLFAAEINDLEDSYPLLEYFGLSVVGIPRLDPASPLRLDALATPWCAPWRWIRTTRCAASCAWRKGMWPASTARLTMTPSNCRPPSTISTRPKRLLPHAPDPELGMARGYYSLRDIDKAAAALEEAEHRGYELANRDKLQLADGYRDRADRTFWDSRNVRGLPQEKDEVERAAADYRRALDLYEGVAPYGNASIGIVRVKPACKASIPVWTRSGIPEARPQK